jgi:hypothetical protein
MNAHAFRSDDLATACRLTVEQEEEKRARRKKWADRERHFTEWWQDEYSTAAIIKVVVGILMGLYCTVLFGFCLAKFDNASVMSDHLACFRACVIHKPIVAAGLVVKGTEPRVCLCYRADGTPAVLVPEVRLEELRKP